MASTRSDSDRPPLALRVAILAIGLTTLAAIVWAKSPHAPRQWLRSNLHRALFQTVFATVRPITDYSVVVRNPNAGTASRILVRVRVRSGRSYTRVLAPGESVAGEALLPGRGPADSRVITDIAVMEQVLARSSVEWWVRT